MLTRRKFLIFIGIVTIVVYLITTPLLVIAKTKKDQPSGVKVKSGDSLWKISREYGLEEKVLAAINGLDSDDHLIIGQTLILPEDNSFKYEVREGENLWMLSRKFDVNLKDLMETNQISSKDLLYIGQKLTIPLSSPESVRSVYKSRFPSRGYERSFFQWPIIGIVSSPFGERGGRMHEGIDIARETGTLIKAAKSGRVAFAGWRGTYGKAVIIDHGDGVRTLYAHASKILVQEGQLVESGEAIAKVGSTGHSTGPHLHFEVLYDSNPLNPERFLPKQ